MAYVSSQGATRKISISSTLTVIPQLVEFTPPGIERRFKDVTNLGSTGNFAEYAALLNDTSTAPAKGYWDPDNSVHDFLMDQAVLASAATESIEDAWANSGASKIAYSAIIMKFAPTTAQNDVLGFDLDFRVTGALTYTQ